MKGHREVEAVSRMALEEFSKANGLTTTDMAEACGYSNQSAYCTAKKNGYMDSEKVFNLCNFFSLPRKYFQNAHAALGDLAIVEKPQDAKPLDKFCVVNKTAADQLLEFYGDTDYTSLFMRLVTKDYEAHKEDIVRKRYEGMTHAELVESMIRKEME